MKSHLFSLVLILSFFMLSCVSKVPMADLSLAVEDDRLLGKWIPAEQDDGEYFEFSLYKFNNKEYMSWIYSEEKDTAQTKIKNKFYRIYFIPVRNRNFFNAQDINAFNKSNRSFI